MKLYKKSCEIKNEAISFECDDGNGLFVSIGAFNQFSTLAKNEIEAVLSEKETLTETNRLLNLECEELKGDVEKLKDALCLMVDFADGQMHPEQNDPSMFDDEDFGNLKYAKELLDK